MHMYLHVRPAGLAVQCTCCTQFHGVHSISHQNRLAVVRTCCSQWTDHALCPSGHCVASCQLHLTRQRRYIGTAAHLSLVVWMCRLGAGLQTGMGFDAWSVVGTYIVMLLLAPGFCMRLCFCWGSEPNGCHTVSVYVFEMIRHSAVFA